MPTGTNTLNQNMDFSCEGLACSSDATIGGALTVTGTQTFTGAPTFSGVIASSGGIRQNATTATTSSTLSGFGVSILAATSTEQKLYVMAAPTVGATKTLISNGASTAQHVSLVSGGIQSTAVSTSGAAYTHVVFGGLGQYVQLVGISTSLWHVVSDPTAAVLATASTV